MTSRIITQKQQLKEYRDSLSEFRIYENTIRQLNGEIGIDNIFEYSKIFILTYDKLIKALKEHNSPYHKTLDHIKVFILDECHTLFSDKFIKDIEVVKVWIRDSTHNEDKIFLGLTATPGIVKHNQWKWGVRVNTLTKDIFIRYKADRLILSSYYAIPFLFQRKIITGKTIILCFTVDDCNELKAKIMNSAVLISRYNKQFDEEEMKPIYDYIIDNASLPETIVNDEGNTVPLEVLICTSMAREGLNLNPECGVENVICCLSDELYVTQFMGRCRFDIKNLIVTRERKQNYHNVDQYLIQSKEDFLKYLDDPSEHSWLDSIKHLLRDEGNIQRIAVDLEAFISYLDEYWINKRIVLDIEREEIRSVAAGCNIISLKPSKITFNKVMDFIKNDLGYYVGTGRCTINGEKMTYKIIRKGE